MAQIFNQAFEQKLIYVYRINDSAHEGILKVGEASCNAGMAYFAFEPNCKELNAAAKERIRHQTQTAGVSFELLYTEATAYMKGKNLIVFQDHEVHDILVRSGIKRKIFDKEHNANEWFYTGLETVKKAIAAAKEGRTSLNASEVSKDKSPIIFRPEQKEAIEKTIKQFGKKNSSHQMLWNAKMRFGKTLTALQVIKELDIRRTLILTHRPVVDKGWFEDYEKIFYDRPEFLYGSKNNGSSLSECEKTYDKSTTGSYIYFASIQDMRGSELVGGKFAKNEAIFEIDWDLIIIDEAHEGTQTELGKAVLSKCRKENTRVLHLSGTPFNLMNDFKEEEIYTWDYVMEQRAKTDWDKIHQGDPNPYAVLPKLNIFTYNLGKLYPEYADADIAFNFREFFRVDEGGDFIHESNVKQFLDLLTKEDSESNYPYSKPEYRENFRHSLWMIPGVKEAKALSKLLQEHPVFSQFNIANVAGDGDEEEEEKEALKKVENAIGKHPEETYSITLSCGRLTTGVSVKPWTACFMLAGSYSTAASTYMQTIFRVQTPAVINGKQKEECFVFDFAPDRTLKVIAETAKISSKAGKTTQSDRAILGDFLNFCPIIGFEGSQMKAYDTEKMLGQLKKVYVERVVKNGFEDSYLYNDELMKLDSIALKEFEDLKKIIGTTKAMAKSSDIDINTLGFTEEEFEQLENQKPQKEPRVLSPEEEALRARLAEAKKNKDAAVSILRGISIRMPLMIYGAELNKNLDGTEEQITIDNFTDIVDDLSWNEFMPQGVTKEKFSQFKKYYDSDVFRESGIRIREMAKAADNLSIEERIERISSIFNTFRNPDKETVLTPWRVVNMHMSGSLGGWCFYDKDFKEQQPEPVFANQAEITQNVFKKNTHILEINSKSGLYALYCAYSVYRTRAKLELGPKPTREMEIDLWKKVLAENIFLICKTPMAKRIANRTLAGFSGVKANAHYFEDLTNQLKNKPENFINKVSKKSYWLRHSERSEESMEDNMKFDAIVGNPPYQEETSDTSRQATPLYNLFMENAIKLNPQYVSMIMPARWFAGGMGLDDFRSKMMNDRRISKIVDYVNAKDCFPQISISGGVCYLLWNRDYNGDCEFVSNINGKQTSELRPLNEFDILIRYNEAVSIVRKIFNKNEKCFDGIISPLMPFGLSTNYRGRKEKSEKDDLLLYASDGTSYISRSEISKGIELIDKYKVLMSKTSAEHAGEPNKDGTFRVFTSSMKVINPKEVCTHSYFIIGNFDDKKEAENVLAYLQTRFVRFLVLLSLSAINLSKLVFSFVPLQDFTATSDIDWNKPIPDIDKQLYKKYTLSAEEISFIESKVREM